MCIIKKNKNMCYLNLYLFSPAELLGFVIGLVDAFFLGLGVYCLFLKEKKEENKRETLMFFVVAICIAAVTCFFPVWGGVVVVVSFCFIIVALLCVVARIVYLLTPGTTEYGNVFCVAVSSLGIVAIFLYCDIIRDIIICI